MTTQDLLVKEYHPFYKTYIDMLSKTLHLIEGFEMGFKTIEIFFKAIPKEKLPYRYAKNKWTIKEIFQHIIDTERIFMYRCFRIARHDKTPLASFNQNNYILPSQANNKTIKCLLEEYRITRQYSILLLKSLNDQDLKSMGYASGYVTSARAAAFSTIGHEIWHTRVIKERYL